ncbi:oxygen-independent coproporphyrinogen III oxidase-like protein [Nitrogeniibacter mangrovi]|uniref:Heme chaperone HemW n=1 Tax=Nitrogeniibacter mangrovi TaxID=2016596 RepID=A0A6C1B0B6_9RHOO|nr:radical SAM family heme chaperone HemW [Nitrogeniibacter mangrovi]QID16439.1 oxygen-independent coproporphyrinogen III oxidase-like protein [Nitrogeniibacter mangrovi]
MNERRVIPLRPQSPQGDAPSPLKSPPPLALYIHFPWCVKKCPYCDFNSHTAQHDGIPEGAYIDALIADLEAALPAIWGRRVLSVFIGGGTPSLLSEAGLDRLLAAVRMRVPLDPMAEITLEANPGTVEAGRFAAYRASGVNRLSLGIQSFDDRYLHALGRIHSGAEARRAAELALTHFERVNFDLMYALPEQSTAHLAADLATAVGFGPQHLSCYHLTLEPNTPFHHSPPPLPDPDTAADMQEQVEATLAEAGYRHYETSAFARKHMQCRHNLNYWTFGDYLGIGAGAHSKLSSHAGIVRQMRHKHPGAYLAAHHGGDFIQDQHAVGIDDLPFEFMMNAMRLIDGVPADLFEARTGLPLAHIEAALIALRDRGLVEADRQQLRPTAAGQRFLNDLLQQFLS